MLNSLDLATNFTLKSATGNSVSGFDAVSALANKLISSLGKFAIDCAEHAIPLIKALSIAITVIQLAYQLADCLGIVDLVITGIGSIDPNEKIGPAGYDAEKFVPVKQPLLYRINFENKAAATAPAQQIRIVDKLPATLDARTVRLREIGFKQTRVEIPENRSFYQNRLQLGADLNNLQADLSAGLDITTGQVSWTLSAIDPQTGEAPLDPNAGLLPPNDAAGDGEGYVTFTIEANAEQPTGANIANRATIYFDDNEPIPTNATANLLDSGIPTSAVQTIAAANQTSQNIALEWSGSDDANGSGLKNFDIYVSENEGAYTAFLRGTTERNAVFGGEYGRTYRFYSIARDNAGNVEAAPETADATATVAGSAYEADVSPRPNGSNDGTITIGDVGQMRLFAAHLEEPDQTNEFERADCAPLATHGDGAVSIADLGQARRFAAGLDAVAFADGTNAAATAPFTAAFSNVVNGKPSSPGAIMSPAVAARELRPAFVSRAGNRVTVAVDLQAQGDETGVGFTLNFDAKVLSNPSNISLGSGATGATLTANTNQAALGKVGIILDKDPRQPFAAGAERLVTIQFDVAAGAPATAVFGFGSAPVAREIVNGNTAVLPTTFTSARVPIVSAPTAVAF